MVSRRSRFPYRRRVRRTLIAVLVLAACSGGGPSEPAGQERVAASPGSEEVEAAPVEAQAGPAQPDEPARLVEAETDGEMAAAEAEPADTEGAVPPPPDEDPPPVADAAQPAAPDADAGAVVDPNLDPEHLEQARKEDMTEREKRAARARAARKAYEQ